LRRNVVGVAEPGVAAGKITKPFAGFVGIGVHKKNVGLLLSFTLEIELGFCHTVRWVIG
jgi:hypothetical protein